MADIIKVTTDATFEQDVLLKAGPVLVDFYATWCGPCNLMAKALDRVAPEYKGRVEFFKLDVDANPAACEACKTNAVPDVRIYKGGSMVARFVGMPNRDKLRALIDGAL